MMNHCQGFDRSYCLLIVFIYSHLIVSSVCYVNTLDTEAQKGFILREGDMKIKKYKLFFQSVVRFQSRVQKIS